MVLGKFKFLIGPTIGLLLGWLFFYYGISYQIVLDNSKFYLIDGHAYGMVVVAPEWATFKSDDSNHPQRSKAKLFENGNALLTNHTPHTEIAKDGKGKWSHWDNQIILSSSQTNAPPTSNALTFSVELPAHLQLKYLPVAVLIGAQLQLLTIWMIRRFRKHPSLISKQSTLHGSSFCLDIQGLRAIAVATVILFHLDSTLLPGGFIGVDIFFVISGYVIGTICLREKKTGNFSLPSFWIKRIRRIVPAYIVMLSIITICMAILFIPKDFDTYKTSLYASLLFISNQYFSTFGDYFAPAMHELPLLHTWSIAIEMQFYLFLSLIVFILPIKYLKKAIVTLAIIFGVYLIFHTKYAGSAQDNYYSLLLRIPEFFVGLFLALVSINKTVSIRWRNIIASMGILAIVWSIFFLNKNTPFLEFLVLIPCFGAAMIILGGENAISRALSTRPLVFIGDISYSLYLWHFPVLAAIRYYLGSYTLSISYQIAFTLFTFTFSYLSFRFIEIPFRRKDNFHNTLRKLTTLAIAITPLFLISTIVNHSLVESLPVELTRYADAKEICHGQIVGNCIRGEHTSDTKILLLGDSQGAQLNHAFDIIGQLNHFPIRIITSSSCIPIPRFNVRDMLEVGKDACNSQIKAAHAFMEEAQIIIVAGLWSRYVTYPEFNIEFTQFLADMTSKKKKVIILGQIPLLTLAAQRTLRFEGLKIGSQRIEQNEEYKMANNKIQTMTSLYPSAQFINLSNNPLFANAPYENNHLIYYDNKHLTEFGSKRFGEIAAPLLNLKAH